MNQIRVQRDIGGIQGLCIIEPQIFKDKRGYLFEAYNDKAFHRENLNTHFVQDNEAYSQKGVLRGFGINIKNPQVKLVRVLSGKIFDVVIDLRPKSKTFMKWFAIELSSDNKQQLYIPEGFAHAYLALKDSNVLFKVTTHYVMGSEVGFAWNSSAFDINWPMDEAEIILSDRDKNNPEFSRSIVV